MIMNSTPKIIIIIMMEKKKKKKKERRRRRSKLTIGNSVSNLLSNLNWAMPMGTERFILFHENYCPFQLIGLTHCSLVALY